MTKTFAIVGAGIGGLTAGIALQRKGYRVRVFESAPHFKKAGAGIVLAPNALKAFREMGLDADVKAAAREIKRFSILDFRGKYINSTDAAKMDRKFSALNTLSLHRADLHDVLVQALGEPNIILGKACVDFEQLDNRVVLKFADGNEEIADYVIAADGIHSVFRKKLVPSVAMRYAGYTCWRAVIENVPAHLQQEGATESWGLGKRFGIVPLSKNRIYWYATLNASSNDMEKKSYGLRELTEEYTDFHAGVGGILDLTFPERLIKNDIFDFKPIRRYAFKNILLLGDAAHATTPNLGQGACLAIEDAAVLGNCLSREQNVREGFRRYEELRITRNTRIVNASFLLGRISQLRNPLLARMRNTAMRLTPESVSQMQLKFLYDVSF